MDGAIEIQEVRNKVIAFYVAKDTGWYPLYTDVYWKIKGEKITAILKTMSIKMILFMLLMNTREIYIKSISSLQKIQ